MIENVDQELIVHTQQTAARLAQELQSTQTRIVFAESCTAGMISALLAQNPGISAWHCGSAVTYREATKTGWLGVSAEDLKQYTDVSEPVARQMAAGVLRNTPEAQLALSITGHFGPQAPAGFDGLAFAGVAWRSTRAEPSGDVEVRSCQRLQLQRQSRAERSWEASQEVFKLALQALAEL